MVLVEIIFLLAIICFLAAGIGTPRFVARGRTVDYTAIGLTLLALGLALVLGIF